MFSVTVRVSAFAAAVVMSCAGPTSGQAYMNPLPNYGRLDQKNLSMNGAMPEFGRWSCGPTSLTNSLGFLERQYPDYYQRTLVPRLAPNMDNAVVTNEELLAVAEQIASPQYMNQSKGVALALRPPAVPPLQDYEYDRDYDSNTPTGGVSGGVTYERFFYGKNCWFTRPAVPATRLYGEYRHSWSAAEGMNLNAVPKPAWVQDNTTLRTELMFRHLREGSDVELGFSWADVAGNGDFTLTGGGHLVTVYGYDFNVTNPRGGIMNGDANQNGRFDPGDFATLKIIDPWAPVPTGINNVAPAIDAVLTSTVLAGGAERLTLGYSGGAAGLNVGFGVVEAWASEIPGPTAGLTLGLGVISLARRRRRS